MTNSAITICVAVPLLLIAVWMFISTVFLLLRGEKTTGIVVEYEARGSSGRKGGVTYAEVVEFQTADGKTIRFAEKGSRSRIFLSTGHTVNVIYDLDNPSKARINSFMNLYLTPIILLIVGSSLIIFNTPSFSGLGQELLKTLQNLAEKIPF